MFEMILTVLITVFAAVFGLSRSVLMQGPYKNYYRIGLVIIVTVIIILYVSYQRTKRRHIVRMNVDPKEYIYYEKYTSLLYRIGYLVSYLVHNLMFDYTYMRRNFNYCKGLDVYDEGVSEYYIKFRGMWYRYLLLTLRRHAVSLKKLQALAADTKNDLIIKGLRTPEEKAMYLAYAEKAKKYFEEHGCLVLVHLESFENADKIDYYFKKNLIRNYQVINYVREREPRVTDLVNRLNARVDKDILDFKKKKF